MRLAGRIALVTGGVRHDQELTARSDRPFPFKGGRPTCYWARPQKVARLGPPWAGRVKTTSTTADILKISEETVETHVRNAIRKLGATNKTHAVAKAIYLGLIDL